MNLKDKIVGIHCEILANVMKCYQDGQTIKISLFEESSEKLLIYFEGNGHDKEFQIKMMDINFTSVFRICRQSIGQMKKQGDGVILNIGSMSGIVSNFPQPQVAYNASKAAVHMLTKSLASDFAENNIRVNAIAPGYIDTDMTRNLGDVKKLVKSVTPMKKFGTADDIAWAAVYLASDESKFVTGQTISPNGGFVMNQ